MAQEKVSEKKVTNEVTSLTDTHYIHVVNPTGPFSEVAELQYLPYPVTTVNTKVGAVVVTPDDLDDTGTTNKFVSAQNLIDLGTALQPANIGVDVLAYSADIPSDTGTQLSDKAPLGRVNGIRTVTAHYELVIDDWGYVVETNHATNAITITLPLFASVALPIKTRVDICRYGAGVATIAAASGVTLNGVNGGATSILSRYDAASLYKRGENEWIITGQIGDVA